MRYSGGVAFGSRVVSAITGLIFVVLVTRNVPLSEFGIWQYLSLIFSYAVFPVGAIGFWTTRYTARGFEVWRTAYLLNILISIAAAAVFVGISPWVPVAGGSRLLLFIILGLQIPFYYLVATMNAVAMGRAPQAEGYGFLVFELTKVGFGGLLVFILRQGLPGALLAVLLATIMQTVFLLFYLRGGLKGSFSAVLAKRWLRAYWLPIYAVTGLMIGSADAIIVTILTNSPEAIAFWKAAMTFTAIISFATLLPSALYPKLLSGGGSKDVASALRFTFMFLIPMIAGIFSLASPLLRILGSQYQQATPILLVLGVNAVINVVWNLLASVLSGTEKTDLNGDLRARLLLKSSLFWVPTVLLVQSLIYIGSVVVITNYVITNSLRPVSINIPLYSSISLVIIQAASLVLVGRKVRSIMTINFPWTAFLKYLGVAVVMSLIVWTLTPATVIQTVLVVILGAVVYFGILLLIEKEARTIARAVLFGVAT